MPGRTPPSRPAPGRLRRPQTPLTEEREPARRTPQPETPQAGGTRDPTSLRPVDRSSRGHPRRGHIIYGRTSRRLSRLGCAVGFARADAVVAIDFDLELPQRPVVPIVGRRIAEHVLV